MHGSATVDVAGTGLRLHAQQGVWINQGVRHSVQVSDDSLTIPVFIPVSRQAGGLDLFLPLDIPRSWNTWLILSYCTGLDYLPDSSPRSQISRFIIDAHHTRREVPLSTLPVHPRSPEAGAVARFLVANPGSRRSIDDFARMTSLSTRTISRQFVAETGLTFSQWRNEVRIAYSARMLSEGKPVSWTGTMAGFETPAGFTRAFRRSLGVTPSQYMASSTGGVVPSPAPAALVRHDMADSPPTVAATTTWPRINTTAVAVWVWRGRATVTVGGRRHVLNRGDALWIPAGVFNVIDIDEDSLLIPLLNGTEPPTVDDLTRLVPIHIPEDLELFLLYTSVSSYTLLGDGTAARPFLEKLLRPDGDGTPPHGRISLVVKIIDHCLRNPADENSLDDWSARTGIPAGQLTGLWKELTGQSYRSWRNGLRMSTARTMLATGRSVSSVTRRLGYSHRSGFTRVFGRFFGVTPGRYQRGVIDHSRSL